MCILTHMCVHMCWGQIMENHDGHANNFDLHLYDRGLRKILRKGMMELTKYFEFYYEIMTLQNHSGMFSTITKTARVSRKIRKLLEFVHMNNQLMKTTLKRKLIDNFWELDSQSDDQHLPWWHQHHPFF